MIEKIWLYLKNGVSIWSRCLTAKDNFDETLLSGLLSATNTLAGETLGTELKDLLLNGKILHQFPVLDNYGRIAVLIDERVPKEKIDLFLKETDNTMLLQLTNVGLTPAQLLDTKIEMTTRPLLTDILEGTATQLDIFNEYLNSIFKESVNEQTINLLEKITDIIPYLIHNNLNLLVQDIESKRTLFSQRYSTIPQQIQEEIIKTLMIIDESPNIRSAANIETDELYVFIGSIQIGQFGIKSYLFTILSKEQKKNFTKFSEIVNKLKMMLYPLLSDFPHIEVKYDLPILKALQF